jgi:hypothetical protein
MFATPALRPLLPLLAVAAGHVLVGCCLGLPGSERQSGADEPAATGGGPPAAPAPAARSAPAAPRTPVKGTGPGGAPTEAELLQAIGGKDSGWLPLVASDLRKGMSPAAVDRLFPGAATTDQFGFSRTAASGVPGAQIKFMFLKGHGLVSLELVWDKALTKAPGFWERLVAVTSAKYDGVKPKDVDKEFGFITWGYSRTAQVAKSPEPGGGESCRLNVQL